MTDQSDEVVRGSLALTWFRFRSTDKSSSLKSVISGHFEHLKKKVTSWIFTSAYFMTSRDWTSPLPFPWSDLFDFWLSINCINGWTVLNSDAKWSVISLDSSPVRPLIFTSIFRNKLSLSALSICLLDLVIDPRACCQGSTNRSCSVLKNKKSRPDRFVDPCLL